MKFFIFVVLIPAIAGVISGMFGLDFKDPLYVLINLPICIISAGIWAFSK